MLGVSLDSLLPYQIYNRTSNNHIEHSNNKIPFKTHILSKLQMEPQEHPSIYQTHNNARAY